MRTSKQYKIAEELNMGASRLSRIKNGDLHAADVNEAQALSDYFGTPIHIWFKGGDVSTRTRVVAKKVAAWSAGQ